MPQYKYRVVPFIGRLNENDNARKAAEQLTDEIQKNIYDGWEFYQLSDVNIQVKPGCLSALFGAKESYVRFDQLIFRKVVDGGENQPPALSSGIS